MFTSVRVLDIEAPRTSVEALGDVGRCGVEKEGGLRARGGEPRA